MKRVYTMISVILALVFCLTALPVSAAPVATATVATVTAARGETVTVPVSITEVAGIGAIALHMYYDGNVLECVDAEAVGIMNQLDMTTANTEPQNRPNQVWLTGMGLKGMSGSGDLVTITFKVKDNAPAGLTVIGFTDEGQELISGSPIEALEMALVDGGIVVSEGEAPVTTEPPLQSDVVTTAAQTTAQTTAPTAGDATATAGNDTPATDAPATEPTTVPTSVAVTNEDGTEVTNKQGETVTKDAVGISIDSVTGKPGETVTVNVSMSAVSDLTALGISITYDEKALRFVSGECQGFVKEQMSFSTVTQDGDNILSIAGTAPQPVSGEGVIATLTFEVNEKAAGGVHALKLSPAPMLMAETYDLPFTVFDGAVTVEDNGASNNLTVLFVVLGVAVAAAIALVVLLIARKKKGAAEKAPKVKAPKQPKPVLPTDISDEDGFDVDVE